MAKGASGKAAKSTPKDDPMDEEIVVEESVEVKDEEEEKPANNNQEDEVDDHDDDDDDLEDDLDDQMDNIDDIDDIDIGEEEEEEDEEVDEPDGPDPENERESSVFSGSLVKRVGDLKGLRTAKFHQTGDSKKKKKKKSKGVEDVDVDPLLVLQDKVTGFLAINMAQELLGDEDFLKSLVRNSTAPKVDAAVAMSAINNGINKDVQKHPYVRLFNNHDKQLSQFTKVRAMDFGD